MSSGKHSAWVRAEEATERCHEWNANHAHQVAAGQARARQFTSETQAKAGHAGWSAFSARWRAGQGLPPLCAVDAQRYVTIEDIRGPLGTPLPAVLRSEVYQAWCAGRLVGVAAWLSVPTAITTDTDTNAAEGQQSEVAHGC